MRSRGRRIGSSAIVVSVLVGAVLVGALAGCALTAAEPDDSRTAAVGRIVDIDTNHGYAIVEFPDRRMFVHLGSRGMDKYFVGDDLRIDSFGRPLPPVPRSPRPSR
jgi:hypothetical protein